MTSCDSTSGLRPVSLKPPIGCAVCYSPGCPNIPHDTKLADKQLFTHTPISIVYLLSTLQWIYSRVINYQDTLDKA
ncbi:uncharacterized protein OCT59_002869 [Rhizophagus irregularis]|uniref:uncharacterized protein n=1 Tax=Rhizophagus irregularis TaxID=588596 RepID=UPI00331C9985|nr:hypothetical protein OCT59_002869 [Rhizophagus irregularis]